MGERTIEPALDPDRTLSVQDGGAEQPPQQHQSPDSTEQTGRPQSQLMPLAPQVGPGRAREGEDGRERFATGELAMVCSHYELGIISAVREFGRGSRQAPKVVLETSRGRVLLKRRTGGQLRSRHIAFCHAVQQHLAERSFPLARLIRSRQGRSSVQLGDNVYEVFEFVNGTRYDRSEPATTEAGRTLAYLHRLLAGFTPPGDPPAANYHHNPLVPRMLRELPKKLERPELAGIGERLASAYELAASRARSAGIDGWPRQVIHCDYHPGNAIYEGGPVRAVVDFDACRIAPRIIDVANGALQFSICRHGPDPSDWPVGLDRARVVSFLRGYDGVEGCILSKAELSCLPWLMTECLIAEAAMPIASTGRFGTIEGGVFLEMVERKAEWLLASHAELSSL